MEYSSYNNQYKLLVNKKGSNMDIVKIQLAL